MNKRGGTIVQQKKAITLHSTNAQGSCYFGPSIKSLIRKDSLSLSTIQSVQSKIFWPFLPSQKKMKLKECFLGFGR